MLTARARETKASYIGTADFSSVRIFRGALTQSHVAVGVV